MDYEAYDRETQQLVNFGVGLLIFAFICVITGITYMNVWGGINNSKNWYNAYVECGSVYTGNAKVFAGESIVYIHTLEQEELKFSKDSCLIQYN